MPPRISDGASGFNNADYNLITQQVIDVGRGTRLDPDVEQPTPVCPSPAVGRRSPPRRCASLARSHADPCRPLPADRAIPTILVTTGHGDHTTDHVGDGHCRSLYSQDVPR